MTTVITKAPVNGAYHPDPEIDIYAGSEAGRYVSEAEYWARYYDDPDHHYEWNNGQLEEKPVGDYVQYRLYAWFVALLGDFLMVNPIARMIGLEMGFRMALPKKVTIRKPDLGVVLNSNPIPLGDKHRSYKGVFDLCIESISDSSRAETKRDTVTKKLEYAAGGVTEYYILDNNAKEMAFYRLNADGIYVPIPLQDGVIHSTILPGFQFRPSDLYHMPLPPLLINDPVYQNFAAPFLRAEHLVAEAERQQAEAERQHAETEKQRAETERQRADMERQRAAEQQQRADRYAARLRAMGINLDEEEEPIS